MGFEPMRLSPADLKSAPLNQARATVQIFNSYFNIDYFFILIFVKKNVSLF